MEMILLRLTYNQTGKTTLVNMTGVRTMFRVASTHYETSTKIEWHDESYINVREDLQTIYRLIREHQMGKYQSPDWDETDPSPMPVRQRFEQAYQNDRRRERERNFNSPGAYNENRF